MKELIEKLRTETWSGFAPMAEQAADALERLELEAVAWELTVDVLRAELERLKTHLTELATAALLDSVHSWMTKSLRVKNFDTCMLHNVELQKELDALKQQKPVGWVFPDEDYSGSVIKPYADAPSLLPVFLAAGAQPVPEGYQLVPCEPTEAMVAACVWEWDSVTIYKAMLEADAVNKIRSLK